MKSLFDPNAAASLVQRIEQLQPQSQPLWGTMTATEMLLHCNKVLHNLMTTPAPASTKKTSVKQYLARWIVLYVMPRFPKGAQAPKQVRTKGLIQDEQFAAQQSDLIQMVHRFAAHTAPIRLPHPYFGNISTGQWGRTAWKHTDHHLRQFGV
jgi:hypothetical protein